MKVHSSRKSSQSRIIKIALAAILLIIIGMFIPRVLHAVGSFVMTPVHAVNTWFETSSNVFPTYLRDRNELAEQIKVLENELATASGQDLTLSRLEQENNKLRKLLHSEDRNRIAAAVIARPNDLPYDLLQIDRGSNDGIKIGAPVYIGSDRFLGLVTEVSSTYAFVKLLTSPGFEATAFIEGSNVVAKIEGFGGGVARVRVPQGITMTIGDLVHLPSMDSGVFGRISYIESRPSQPEQYGYITPDIALHSIYFVAVGATVLTPSTESEVSERINELISSQLIIEGLADISTASSTSDISSSTQP